MIAGIGVDLEQRDVRGRVTADEGRLQGVVVREPHLDRRRSVDDVVVGDDVTLFVEDEPRAEGLRGLLELVGGGVGGADRRGDLHDAWAAALVDLVDRECGAGRGRQGAGGGGRLLHDRRRGVAVESADRRGSAERGSSAEHGGDGEQGKGLGGRARA